MNKPKYVLYFYTATGRHKDGDFVTKAAAETYGDLLMEASWESIIRVEVRREDPEGAGK